MKDHKELGLTFPEYGALLGTKALLESGMLWHNPSGREIGSDVHQFDLGTTCKTRDCGSISCIGGTMAIIMGMDADAADKWVWMRRYDRGLEELFFPRHLMDSHAMEEITPEQAAAAIGNFLQTGQPEWKKVAPNLYAV